MTGVKSRTSLNMKVCIECERRAYGGHASTRQDAPGGKQKG